MSGGICIYGSLESVSCRGGTTTGRWETKPALSARYYGISLAEEKRSVKRQRTGLLGREEQCFGIPRSRSSAL